MPADYDFTVDWFSSSWPSWVELTRDRAIRTALEIGSFEGRSTCRMIESFGAKNPLHVVCVDTWGGGVEHAHQDMSAAERRFDANTRKAAAAATHKIDVTKLKGLSADQLLALLAAGWRGNFDLVFVDGSHQAPDVLSDLLLGYELARVGGLIICDDYLWSMEKHGAEDLLNMPRMAIDAFKTIFARKVRQFSMPAYQCYMEKTA